MPFQVIGHIVIDMGTFSVTSYPRSRTLGEKRAVWVPYPVRVVGAFECQSSEVTCQV